MRVSVPASSANLGPGFDVLAIALDLENVFDVWETGNELRVEVKGEGADWIPTDHSNLFVHTMQSFFAYANYQPSGLVVREHNRIPISRGLGSSAATIAGALLAARHLSGFSQVDDDQLLQMAAAREGHGDNVTVALRGGFQMFIKDQTRHLTRRLPWPPRLGCAVFVPELLVSTESAREVLPEQFSRADVIHNLSRMALFISALHEGRFEDLRVATEDRLHQPYRAELVPGLDRIIAGALAAGAFGAFLSGAGPSLVALYDRDASAMGERVAGAMQRAAADYGLEGRTMVLQVRPRGADFRSLPQDPSGTPFTL